MSLNLVFFLAALPLFSAINDIPCAGCINHRMAIFPFLQNLTTNEEFEELRRHFLTQVDQRVRTNFSISVYLPGKSEWFHCCNARDCSRRFLHISRSDFTVRQVTGSLDIYDSTGLWKIVNNTTSIFDGDIYVVADYFVPQICHLSHVRMSLIMSVIGFNLPNKCNITLAPTLEHLNAVKVFYHWPSNEKCPHAVANNTIIVDFRIFLGFATKTRFTQIVNGLMSLLSQPSLDNMEGMIAIIGKRAGILANCYWYNIQKCILALYKKGEKAIHVNASRVDTNDILFAPDVIGFMRRELLRNENKTRYTVAFVFTDFVSLLFPQNSIFFDEVRNMQRFKILMGVMLKWNGLDRITTHKYYSQLPASIYPMESLSELNGLASIIASVGSEPEGGSTVTPQVITPMSMLNKTFHGSDVVIVLALAEWTTDQQLRQLKNFLSNSAGACVSDAKQYLILRNVHEEKHEFCNDKQCLQDEINGITPESSVSAYHNALEAIRAGLQLLEPPQHDQPIMPQLIVLTNYIDLAFMREYDDGNPEFRMNLSFVDFQIILVNSSGEYHMQTSLNNKMIHRIKTFEELESTPNPMCMEVKYSQVPKTQVSKRVIAGSVAVGVIVVAFILVIAVKIQLRPKKTKDCPHLAQQQPFDNIAYLYEEEIDEEPLEGNCNMLLREISQLEEIGKGEFGVVYRAKIQGPAPRTKNLPRYRGHFEDCFVAQKFAKDPSKQTRQQLIFECKIMMKFRIQPNIVTLLGYVTGPLNACILLEYTDKGTLKSFMEGKGIIPASDESCHNHVNAFCCRELFAFLRMICTGLSYVHRQGVIHRDVAARNMLMFPADGRETLIVKLADFGLAMISGESSPTLHSSHTIGTRILPWRWTAVEGLNRNNFSEKSDVWSFAVCAWEVLTCGMTPFEEVEEAANIVTHLMKGRRPHRPYITCDPLWQILNDCWEENPEDRPTFDMLVERLTPLLDKTSNSDYVLASPVNSSRNE